MKHFFSNAPMPSPEEQKVIDYFGIYGERADPPYSTWVCKKRVTYANRKEATTALNHILRQRAIKGQTDQFEERYHWCSHHEGFHLTSKRWGGR